MDDKRISDLFDILEGGPARRDQLWRQGDKDASLSVIREQLAALDELLAHGLPDLPQSDATRARLESARSKLLQQLDAGLDHYNRPDGS
jgi:hypothetical protein